MNIQLEAIDLTIRWLVYRARFDHVSEVLLDYRADAEQGTLSTARLRGFIQGLWCCGYLTAEDYCDIDRPLELSES